MLDFVLGAILVALAVRGWMRGFAREAIGLAVILAGLVFAFRLSTPVGAVVEAVIVAIGVEGVGDQAVAAGDELLAVFDAVAVAVGPKRIESRSAGPLIF